MIDLIRSFFVSVGEFFSNIWDALVFFFVELTQFFKMLSPALKFFQILLSTIHPIFLAFGVAMLVVLLIYIIIGRTAGGD